MADVMNRNNPYTAPRAALKDDRLTLRQRAVVWASAAVRAVLDLAILLLMLLALTAVFDLLHGESRGSWAISVALVAGLAVAIGMRGCLVAPGEHPSEQGRLRSQQ